MGKHYLLTDEAFEELFVSLALNPKIFSHEAHLRLAWIHIKKYGVEQAVKNMCAQIKAFATYHGDAGKYNETVTVAAVRAVYHFMLKGDFTDFASFIRANDALKTNFKGVLDQHYATDIFHSEADKEKYLAPELLPFD